MRFMFSGSEFTKFSKWVFNIFLKDTDRTGSLIDTSTVVEIKPVIFQENK